MDSSYRDLGTLATIGRNRAVVDLGYFRFQGLVAWFFWMFIHLMAIVGVKNRLIIFINWAYYYFTYDQSLRLIIKPKMREGILSVVQSCSHVPKASLWHSFAAASAHLHICTFAH